MFHKKKNGTKMNKEYLFRFVNVGIVFEMILYLTILFYIPFSYFNGMNFFFVLNSYLFLVYLILYFWFNIYCFSPESLVIYNPFRFRGNNKRVIPYNEIESIRYNHKAMGSRTAVIIFEFKRKCLVVKPANQLYVLLFKDRKNLLKFLASKGVSIEINADIKKDREILS